MSCARCNVYLPIWIQIWLVASSLICMFDIFFTMYRPMTLAGGELDWLTLPWRWYSDIDLRYNSTSDPVTCATGRVMIVEIVMALAAVILSYLPCISLSQHSVIMAYTSSAFTFWKTVWYMTMYIMPPEGSPDYLVDDFSAWTIFVFWFMDGIWVVIPLLVMLRLWPRMMPDENTVKYKRVHQPHSDNMPLY